MVEYEQSVGLTGAIRPGEHDATLTVPIVELVRDPIEDIPESVRGVCGSEQPIRIVLKTLVIASDLVGLEDSLESSFEDLVAGGK
jgi:hypothetical protein